MIIGIDLHGTLLNKDWSITESLVEPLNETLAKLNEKTKIYTCTGNDLSFVKTHIPSSIQEYFSGYVLETGCVISDREKVEIITTEKERRRIRNLEKRIKEGKFSFDLMGRRLSSITMFTKNPKGLYMEIDNFLKKERIRGVDFFWSDVAVDIVPSGYNKYIGLMKFVNGDEKVGAIADSMNDASLVSNVDYGFVPANAPRELLTYIEKRGKRLINIEEVSHLDPSYIVQADKERTEAVIEILNLIEKLI